MKGKLLISFLFVLLLSSCEITDPGENSDPVPNIDTYPTTIYALDSVTLKQYKNEFRILNNDEICTPLNKFGFCEYKLSPCLNRYIFRVEIKDENRMVKLAKECIIKNSKYTGVTIIPDLEVELSHGFSGCIKCDGSDNDMKFIKWTLRFKNQVYDGYEVLGTGFFVFLNYYHVTMLGGNWYPKIFIPAKDKFDLEKAKEILDGHKITIHCFTTTEGTINIENIDDQARKVILPIEYDNKMELRIAWEIFINRPGTNNHFWVSYVDTMTGEILKEYFLLICG